MSKTNFDKHLDKHLQDPAFAERFQKADEAWDIALQLSDLRQRAGLSQAQLARKLKTSQQQISRLESANYEGHSLSMLRRVAEALNAKVIVSFQTLESRTQVSEAPTPFQSKAKATPEPRKTASRRPVKRAKKSATKRLAKPK